MVPKLEGVDCVGWTRGQLRSATGAVMLNHSLADPHPISHENLTATLDYSVGARRT